MPVGESFCLVLSPNLVIYLLALVSYYHLVSKFILWNPDQPLLPDELGDLTPELKLSLFQLGISPQIAASILMQV